MVYSSGFSFANYDSVVIAKPTGEGSTVLYGMDVEFSNLMSRYNMKVIGDREYDALPLPQQLRSVFARISVSSVNKKWSVLSVTFDDAVTGRTGASITAQAKVDLFDAKERSELFEKAAISVVEVLERDKGLIITDSKK